MQCWRAIFRVEKVSVIKKSWPKIYDERNYWRVYEEKGNYLWKLDINIWTVQGEEKNRSNPM